MSDRPDTRRDASGKIVAGQAPAAKAAAAQSLFVAAGLAIEEVDGLTWRIAGYTYYPAGELWMAPDGTQGYGPRRLIAHRAGAKMS
jgi:hypothetical protein